MQRDTDRLQTAELQRTPEQLAATIAAKSAEIGHPLEDWQIRALSSWLEAGYLTPRHVTP